MVRQMEMEKTLKAKSEALLEPRCFRCDGKGREFNILPVGWATLKIACPEHPENNRELDLCSRCLEDILMILDTRLITCGK